MIWPAKGDEDKDEEEVKGWERSEMAEESGEGASEAEGLIEGRLKEIWMPCMLTVQSRYEAASSKLVRSDILALPRCNIPYHTDLSFAKMASEGDWSIQRCNCLSLHIRVETDGCDDRGGNANIS